ncbi:MAG: response regulator transcription factor [Allosphingosinicella sp.]
MPGSRVVHLVDDDAAVRRSVSFMLRTSGYTVKTYVSGAEILASAATLPGGVVVMDVRMPDMDGLEVLGALRERGVSLPVVVITGHGDIGIAVRAMKKGALDFIEKPFEAATLIAAIEEGFADRARDRQRAGRAREAQLRLGALTARESEVLAGLVEGRSNKAIATDLGISARTVEIHRAHVMKKLRVASLSEALRIAFAAGLAGEAQPA